VAASEVGGGWREPIRGKEGGQVCPAATRHRRGGPGSRQRHINGGHGDGWVSSALCHAEEMGKSARAPGERKEGGRGRGPAERHSREDTGARQRPGARARSARRRGVGQRASGEKGRRERARERWRSGRIDPTVGPARRERRWTGHCGWPARRWGPLAAGREV
jgi:hypothetical protein